jgi:hypothetical protein
MNRIKAKNIREIRRVYEFVSDELQCETHKGEIQDLIGELETEDDFHIELDGNEYRFIDAAEIDDIAEEEIKELVKDCYLDGMDLDKHWWIEIDWKKTADNCISADGYGHHFSSYDGSEEEARLLDTDWYIFRTN